MMMTKKLVWRLSEKPSGDVINRLVERQIITKEEARDVLFSEDEQPKKATPNEIDDVKKEVELLREIVLALASKRDAATVIYKYVDRWPYTWTQPYVTYCSSNGGAGGSLTIGTGTTTNAYSTFTNASNTLLK